MDFESKIEPCWHQHRIPKPSYVQTAFEDEKNSQGIFGQTAYYKPSDQSIVLYITNRHPKDICRSFAHELVHHHQNERGDLDMGDASSPTYAQDDKHMRKMEMEAYLKGNLLFRDWEDWYKNYRQTNQN